MNTQLINILQCIPSGNLFEEQKKKLQQESNVSTDTKMIYCINENSTNNTVDAILITPDLKVRHLKQYVQKNILCSNCCNDIAVIIRDVKTGRPLLDEIEDGCVFSLDFINTNTGKRADIMAINRNSAPIENPYQNMRILPKKEHQD